MLRVLAAGLATAVLGYLMTAPTPASATAVSIDDIIFQRTAAVNQSVYSATAYFFLLGNTV